MDFDIVKTEDFEFFKAEVKRRLAEGWELHGEMKTYPAIVDDGAVKGITYMQGLVKRENNMGKKM